MMTHHIFNVLDFGAVPDATFDATEAFQEALDAAGRVHGVVEVPSGRFYVGELKVPAGVTISGTYTWNWSSFDGFHGTILTMNRDDAAYMLDVTEAYGAHLKGISMDGGHRGKGTHGVLIDRTDWDPHEDGLKIEGCRIGYFSGDSVRVKYVRGVSVRHSMLCFSDGWSFYMTGEDAYLYDNWFSSSVTGNVALGGFASDVKMFCNRCEDTRGLNVNLFLPMGDEPTPGCHDIIIESNCFCGGSTGGVRAVGTPESVMENVIIMGNAFNVNGGAEDTNLEKTSTHIWLEYLKNSIISANTLFAGRGFFQTYVRVFPSFGMVMEHLENCIIAENGMNFSGSYQTIVNNGHNTGTILRYHNQGREVPQLDGYLYPWWQMRQFPEAERDALARQRGAN